MSRKPRTAFVGVPSGAGRAALTPKKARKYRLAESSSISVTRVVSLAGGAAAAARSSAQCDVQAPHPLGGDRRWRAATGRRPGHEAPGERITAPAGRAAGLGLAPAPGGEGKGG